MEIYLAIITTALVLTQIIRVTQNTIQLRRQRKTMDAQLSRLEELTNLDIKNQRRAYTLAIAYFEKQLGLNKKHGSWIYDGKKGNGTLDWFHCSECGTRAIHPLKEECPKCGAVMDKKEEQK